MCITTITRTNTVLPSTTVRLMQCFHEFFSRQKLFEFKGNFWNPKSFKLLVHHYNDEVYAPSSYFFNFWRFFELIWLQYSSSAAICFSCNIFTRFFSRLIVCLCKSFFLTFWRFLTGHDGKCSSFFGKIHGYPLSY